MKAPFVKREHIAPRKNRIFLIHLFVCDFCTVKYFCFGVITKSQPCTADLSTVGMYQWYVLQSAYHEYKLVLSIKV